MRVFLSRIAHSMTLNVPVIVLPFPWFARYQLISPLFIRTRLNVAVQPAD